MAIDSVNEVLSLINNQIEFHEKIQEILMKAEALSHISTTECFFDCDRAVMHPYLWMLSDLISNAKTISDESLICLSRDAKVSSKVF